MMGKTGKRILMVLALPIGLLALLFATATYLSLAPHLLIDPISRSIYSAARASEPDWRSVDVDLLPHLSAVDGNVELIFGRLEAAGYTLDSDYSVATGKRAIPGGQSQQELDWHFSEARAYHNQRGITHVFERAGRFRVACGESFFIELGITDGKLTHAAGYWRSTGCL